MVYHTNIITVITVTDSLRLVYDILFVCDCLRDCKPQVQFVKQMSLCNDEISLVTLLLLLLMKIDNHINTWVCVN